ncbi:hypothetical protein C922_02236 [Plasmodium inui San Antonio 1]|uniref:Dynein attachment factor N-terminal domain-containing protein n=1 Tax=Plasmodium inui San Antonio 1 TaxID=1237626 RepID=W7A7G8_9APIC|nr:hypothetical protein C922_02236 [Plasmodium inui San Antonio 1]EUD67530.1 hypothetical protein C922_02236 [Plasmodium inui San Antonio 1]
MNPGDGIAPIEIGKMRDDFVRCIMKDEEYKKKDEKKKEIVKYCKSYKDFCNIVSSVNMKPVRTYEAKVSYEEYVHLNVSSSQSRIEAIKRRNRRSQNFQLTNLFQINSPVELPSRQEVEERKSGREIQQFLNMLWDNQEDYANFIKRNYTSDELTDLLSFIRRKWDVLFEPTPAEHPVMEKAKKTFFNLANFLIQVANHWENQNLSAYFTQDELNDINLNLQDVIGKMEKTASTYDDEAKCEAGIMINQLKVIHL